MRKVLIVISFFVMLAAITVLLNLYIETNLDGLALLILAAGTIFICGAIFIAIYNFLDK